MFEILDRAQHVERVRLGRIDRYRRAQVLLGEPHQIFDFSLIFDETAHDWTDAQRATQFQRVGVPGGERDGTIGVGDSSLDPFLCLGGITSELFLTPRHKPARHDGFCPLWIERLRLREKRVRGHELGCSAGGIAALIERVGIFAQLAGALDEGPRHWVLRARA